MTIVLLIEHISKLHKRGGKHDGKKHHLLITSASVSNISKSINFTNFLSKMKFALALISLATLATQSFGYPVSEECTNGAFKCHSDVVYQCNIDHWVVNADCGSSGLVCNFDHECVNPGDWSLNIPPPVLGAPTTPAVPSGSCTNGAFECIGNVVYQCNIDSWVVNADCGSAGLVCNFDHECVNPGDWSLNIPPPVLGTPEVPDVPSPPSGSCTNGAFECVGDVVYQCNIDTWVSNADCYSQGLVCNFDFECVDPGDWSLEIPPLTVPEPPTGTCTNGAFECIGNVVYQCNIDTWVVNADCGSQGLMCNFDYECVYPGDWSLSIEHPEPAKASGVTPLCAPEKEEPLGLEGSCTNGAFNCVGNVVYQCNIDSWVVNADCGSAGLVCNFDYECVNPGDWSLEITTSTPPLSAPTPTTPTVPSGSCTNGAFECIGNVVYQCNIDSWVVNADCGSAGLVCNFDYECVNPGDWSLEITTSTAPLTPPPTPTVPSGSCTNGSFECIGNVVYQCNIDHWVVNADCGSAGLVCNFDHECVNPGDWSLDV